MNKRIGNCNSSRGRASERPKSYFIKKALELYLQEYEDYQIALARRADKDDEVLTLAQVRKALGA